MGNFTDKFGYNGIFPSSSTNPLNDAINKENSVCKPDSSYTGKYDIQHLTYPADLFDPQKPSSPYVLFMINDYDYPVGEEEQNYVSPADNKDIQNKRKRGGYSRMGVDPGVLQFTTSVMGAATVVGVAEGLLGVSRNKKDGGGNIARAAGETVLGTGALMATYSGLNFTKAQKRLKKAIALHMPNNLATSYSSIYSDISSRNTLAAATIIGDVVGGVKTGSNMINEILDVAGGPMENLATTVGANISQAKAGMKAEAGRITDILRNVAMSQIPGGKQISAATGLAANPRIQAVFEMVKPREFQMHYTFFPKSEGELNDIHNIIKTFKKHMLPAYKSADEWLFVYPSEFDIEYRIGDKENGFLHKHTSCVLLDMAINYTPDNTYSHFGNGASTKIDVTLTFREVDIVTRQDVEQGY